MKPSQLINEALEFLGPNGERWGQGAFRTEDGRYCILGALSRVQVMNGTVRVADVSKACVGIYNAIREYLGDCLMDIPLFNDGARDFSEVRTVMEKARAALQEQGQ